MKGTSPNCDEITSHCALDAQMKVFDRNPTAPNWRQTRCSMDTRPPSGAGRTLRNCLDLLSFDIGHKRFPDPPDNRISFISETPFGKITVDVPIRLH
ncbi:hypothetical protein GCM10025857_24360 [Alicyclobacillus contaminans]|nr:hypothetical protein GCM10025857_24360 [Alicyclobacillus contaminans]